MPTDAVLKEIISNVFACSANIKITVNSIILHTI
jgi:hypothetical protein